MKKILLFVIVACLSACDADNYGIDDENPDNQISATEKRSNNEVNKWIWQNMSQLYYWNNTIAAKYYTNYIAPKDYFKSLMVAEDKWSYITDDFGALEADLDGEPVSMGYDPSFYYYGTGNNVLIAVNFVYPNSPADKAGLKRGDIIVAINGQRINDENYYDLYNAETQVIVLGEVIDDAVMPSNTTMNLEARVVDANPVLANRVFDVIENDGTVTRIGYLAFMQFTAGSDNKYIASLENAFDNFAAKGVKKLIVDLRYNSGGAINVAQTLASMIVPQENLLNGDLFVTLNYNSFVTEYYTRHYGDDVFKYRFEDNGHNANISDVYFMVTRNSASASELTIIGLQPYMNTTIIGTNTYGKYTGSIVVQGEDDYDNWGIMPIVLKYKNANGFTDFVDGLTPDFVVTENHPTGDYLGADDDEMFVQAVNVAVRGKLISDGELIAGAKQPRLLSASKPVFGQQLIPASLKQNAYIKLK